MNIVGVEGGLWFWGPSLTNDTGHGESGKLVKAGGQLTPDELTAFGNS